MLGTVLSTEDLVVNKMWSLPLMILQSIFFINPQFHEGVSVMNNNLQNIIHYEGWDCKVLCVGQVREDLR